MSVDRSRRKLLQAMAAASAYVPLHGVARSCLADTDPDPRVTGGFTTPYLASPVGWVYSADHKCTGTCFLIADNWIATALHVIEDETQAASRVVVFNYTHDGAPCDRDTYALSPYEGGYVRPEPGSPLDFCLVRVTPKASQPRGPGAKWGRFPLHRAVNAKADDPVTLVHHPDRRMPGTDFERRAQHFKCSSTSHVVQSSDVHCVHAACAEEGSSGGALVTLDGRLVGIHSRMRLDEVGEQVPGCWVATSAIAILESLRANLTLSPEQNALLRGA